ncbi:hypothetical protein FH581_017205 (plasmid) [Leptospira weilii]|uniref:hypothetical protein n=1 Tax=Leptospira weilii TaxID=28184 RepID=UPI001EF3399D|nr:hypothetical protein [Leptospira weilii]ULH29029.1 hypothetical protein FH586_03565 [Leptospira weilii]UPY79918.1 hypothetical protein FH581_018010 [Leptospira weilii]UPY80320.1 hypothetical protein FH581_023830 [Leptospira weilii]UPY80344.1 hypothetical protein FH581_023970 [Leptospira weilii]UPY80838.1 hypothetical protein FH581_022460 [Leptospira weilii]
MQTTFKAQIKIQLEDLEFNDISDGVQENFGVVNINTITQYIKRRLGVSQATIEKLKEDRRG